jgi:hypothetical protein
MNLNQLSNLDVRPFSLQNPDFCYHVNFAFVLFLVAFAPSPIFDKILYHGDSHNNSQWKKHRGFSLTDCYLRNDLENSNDKKINFINKKILLDGFVN